MNFFKRFSQKSLKKQLENIDPDSIPFFSFQGINTTAYVSRVYDGDTITIIFDYKKELIKYSVRIYGIDTPEIRTKDSDEKKHGYEARDFLSSILLDQFVNVDLMEFDKYGRLLAKINIEYDGKLTDISELMIQKGYAKPYFGGTK